MSLRIDNFIRTCNFCNERNKIGLVSLKTLRTKYPSKLIVYEELPPDELIEKQQSILQNKHEQMEVISYLLMLMNRIKSLFFKSKDSIFYPSYADNNPEAWFHSFFYDYMSQGIGHPCKLYSLGDALKLIEDKFPYHSYNYYLILLGELNERFSQLFPGNENFIDETSSSKTDENRNDKTSSSKTDENRNDKTSLSKTNEMMNWLKMKIEKDKALINRDLTRRTQYCNNLKTVTSNFYAKMLSGRHHFNHIEHFKFCCKNKKGKLTLFEIEKISIALTSVLKKMTYKGQGFYAKKISYDEFLGLQIDVMLLTKSPQKQTQLTEYWRDLIRQTLFNAEVFCFYSEEAIDKFKKDSQLDYKAISQFFDSKLRFSYYLDSHLKLELPTIRNFTKSR